MFGKALVVAQVALSVVVLSLATGFALHLSKLRGREAGFDRESVLLVGLDPGRSGYQTAQLSTLYRDLLPRLQAIPGVRSATIAAVTPIEGAAASSFLNVEGFTETPDARRRASLNWVGPDYFATFGTPIVAGRDFNTTEAGGSRVALVNEAMSRYYFGDRGPIGRHFTFEGYSTPYQIIGVVADAKYSDLHEPAPRTVYLHAFQDARGRAQQVALRTSVPPLTIAPDVRRMVRETLETVTVAKMTTLADQVDASIVPERLMVTLSGLFAALGASLAAIGLYGLLAYTVARRVNEIGVRRALGATEWDVTRMVLKGALGLLSAGLLAGAPLAFWSRRFAASMVENLSAGVTWSIVAAAVMMTAIALLAAYVPARRAARVNPVEALRRS